MDSTIGTASPNENRPVPIHPKVLVVFNPQAGQALALRSAIDRAIALWQTQGWEVSLEPTQCAGDGTRIAAAAAAAKFNIVVAVGGDGTVNEVMNGLVNTETALGVLPAGTVNIWAREMGLPMDIPKSALELLKATWRKIDVGRAQTIKPKLGFIGRRRKARRKLLPGIDRYFLLMAGIGFDAAVTAGLNPAEKKYLGAIAYVKQGIQLFWKYKGSPLTIYLDGQRMRGRILLAVVGNSQLYGGVMKFTMHALVDDGLLDVCLVKGHSMLKAPLRLLSILFRRHQQDDRIEYHRVQQIQFLSRKPVPIQIDGDYLGTTPIRLDVVPRSLWVLVPPQADRTLWQDSL